MKNKVILFKKDDLTIFLHKKRCFLSVLISEDELSFQKYFYENFYNQKRNFLLQYCETVGNELIFIFPEDFNFINYTFKNKNYFLSKIGMLKKIIFKDTEDLEYDLNHYIIKSLLSLKPNSPFDIKKIESFIKNKHNYAFYDNVISDLIFDKLLIHKNKPEFFFLDYSVYSLADSIRIENNKKIKYSDL